METGVSAHGEPMLCGYTGSATETGAQVGVCLPTLPLTSLLTTCYPMY